MSSTDGGAIPSSFRIDPLAGAENYTAWSTKVKDLLTGLGLEEQITSSKPVQGDKEAADDFNKRLAAWRSKDKQALSHVRLRVSDAVLVYISSVDTSKEAWDVLSDTYLPKGVISLVTARRKLFRAECAEGNDVPEHIRSMRALVDEIHAISGKAVISDDDFAITLLVSLPESWNNFIQSIDSTSTLSSANIISRILQEDRRRKEKGGASDEAMVAKQKKKSRPKCYNCGKNGHLKRDCTEPPKASGKQKSGGDDKANETVEFVMIAVEGDESGFSAAEPDLEKALISTDESRVWFGDSASTTHVANCKEAFFTFNSSGSAGGISGLGGTLKILGRGSIKLNCKVGNDVLTVWLHDVAYVPGAPHNLLSLSRADHVGCTFKGGNGTLTIFAPNGCAVMTGRKAQGPRELYRMAVAPVTADQAHVAILGKRTWEEFHKAMGHVNVAALKRLRAGLAEGISIDETSDDNFQCEPCVRAKQHVKPFPAKATRQPENLEIGEIVVSDVWGPAQVRSVRGYSYFMTFTDLCSRFSCLNFSATKSGWSVGALKECENILRRMSRKMDRTGNLIMCLRIDNGTEYINKEFLAYCKSQGIIVETTAPHSPAQNGVAERLNRTLVESARAMLLAQHIPQRFWPEAIAFACYIKNRAPTAALEKTPYEALTGEKPDLSDLHEFGSKCWVLDQSGERGKLDPKSRPCLFLGFAGLSKAYLCWDQAKNSIVKSRNVVFAVPTRPIEDSLPPVQSAPTGESGKDEGSRAPTGGAATSTKIEPASHPDGGAGGNGASSSAETQGSGGARKTKPVKSDAPPTAPRERSTRLASKEPVDYLRMHNPRARGS